jgi:benzoyl-CoA reductase/2-hydroxyglutaryl-CoA dehydratase subunit BcrC/BadD/HgdB
VALLSKNKWILKDIIKKYDGKVVSGILVTESEFCKAAHLGSLSVKRYQKIMEKNISRMRTGLNTEFEHL